jgi:hypothetical protein
VSVNKQVAIETELADADIEGFTLNDTLDGLNGTTPSASAGVAYTVGRFQQGLSVTPGTTEISYSISIPSEFNTTFWIRPGAKGQDLDVLTLHGTAGDLMLKYDGDAGVFYLLDSSSNRLNAPVALFEAGDPVLIGIVQTSTTRRLFVGVLKEEAVVSNSVIMGPIGSFTQMNLY